MIDRFGSLNEAGVRDILIQCQGDMIQAARRLRIRTGKLNSYIRTVPSLKTAWLAMERVKASPEYDTLTADSFRQEIDALISGMQLDALEEIYELAMMPVDYNPGMAEVKLKAAIHLRGPVGANQNAGDIDGLFHELNQLYQTSAPRIKGMRVQVEMVTHDPPEPVVAQVQKKSERVKIPRA